MRARPKIEDYKNAYINEGAMFTYDLMKWAKEADKEIKELTEGLTTIVSLGSGTDKSGEQFLTDIAVGTLNKVNKDSKPL